jgi:hypothetical protein
LPTAADDRFEIEVLALRRADRRILAAIIVVDLRPGWPGDLVIGAR